LQKQWFFYFYGMIKQIVSDFISDIKKFEFLLRKEYHFTDDHRIIPSMDYPYGKKGQIENYIYWFHGSGCSLKNGEIEYHYDYHIREITFSLWSIKTFIETHPHYDIEDWPNKLLERELYRLIEQDILAYLIEGGVVLQVYRVTGSLY